ncbi:hypothetical protein Vadar_033197 [Vaccinium darrowii]|uniref:Uncharacterized protein n=1 Tax=Vaccinium darrowii TaxID=229202 RepID=A0ACB7XWK2_9ERIC|nr:hypothetical protein Vadar_033197 [Vaccinium darrowii]
MSSLKIDDENDFDMDDVMDEAAKFDLLDNIDLELENDDEVPEKTENETKKGGDGLVSNKRATCGKDFKVITPPEGHPKPRAACNWCGVSYACHSKNNVVLDPRCKVGFFEYCFLNALGFDKKLVSEMTDKITHGITELFEWYVRNNASVNVCSREEVGGASNKVDLDGLDDQKSLKSLFKIHQQNETNMASKSKLEKHLLEASEDDNERFDIATN